MSSIQSITYEGVVAVTQSDAVADPAGPFAGFFASVAGVVKIQTLRNDTVTLTILAGIIYPIAITRIWSSTTTASGLFGLCANPYRPAMNPGTGTVLP